MATQGPALLVYGAYGYTARLLLEQLRALGVNFWVAGRSARRVADAALDWGAPSRVFSLEDPVEVARGLAGVEVLLNVAGPFERTIRPLLDGCLRAGVHYLDLSGEVEAFDIAAGADAAARARGVMVLPGIGFDVVPSDCLAVHLARRLPGAERLELHISLAPLISRGSAATVAAQLGRPVYVRRAGVLRPLMLRSQLRWVDFGGGVRPALAASWGDLVSAHHSTGIDDIQVFFEAHLRNAPSLLAQPLLAALPTPRWVAAALGRYIDRMPAGPGSAARRGQRSVIVGEVWRGRQRARSRLSTGEHYTFTARAGAAVVQRVLRGSRRGGFQTPGRLLGADFVMSFDDVVRQDLW